MRFLTALLYAVCFYSQVMSSELTIPPEVRFTIEREGSDVPLVYYFEQPQKEDYPILMLCGGSNMKGDVVSVFRIYEEFKERIHAFQEGYLAVEKWGVDGNSINEKEFWEHYSWSQRLKDHLQVIRHLQANPPQGWNGKFVFIGGSEGGILVTDLTMLCEDTLATINWVGAADESWDDEVWQFFEHWKNSSIWMRLYSALPKWLPFSLDFPQTREEFDEVLQEIRNNPTPEKWLGGLTYFYFADALQRQPVDYAKIRSPFLVVEGTEDSALRSCDLFVQKATAAGVPITYFRVEGMGHEIRERPDVIEQSFLWLEEQLLNTVH